MNIRRTFVAELGSAIPDGNGTMGEYMARAKCTRCSPVWMGPKRSMSQVAADSSATISPDAAVEKVRDACRRDVLLHTDSYHDGVV